MGSNSGIRDGEFDRISVAYDFAVGQDQNFGENGQVLISGGENNELTWGSNSASLPESLTAGANITFTPDQPFNGLVPITISSTDTGTTYTGVAPIVVDNGADTISLSNDATLTTIANELSVVKVPNNLTAGTGLSFASGSEFNGANARELVCSITQGITGLDEGDGINITAGTSATEKTISANIDTNTLEFITDTLGSGEPKEIAVKKLPHSLTAGSNITFTPDEPFNGSKNITISSTDTGTTYTGVAPIVVDNSADTIGLSKDGTLTTISNELSVVKVPNNLTAGTGLSF
eukprot:SAG22_NODE_4692_length_1191_cov_0.825092_2_plen_291_part_01